MSDLAIRVDNLGKKYRIGRKQRTTNRLSEKLSGAFAALGQRLAGRAAPVPPEEVCWAVRNVSFEIKRGEVVGIIGRNGAGKSTLMKLLSRITYPTEGREEIYGRLGSLLEVGTGFHPELTGRENIFLNGTILGMSRREIRRKFDEIVAFAEIDRFLDTPVKHYSSGMYVRLAFAVAAHLEPEILLVDEVLAVGDAAFQKKCMGKMGEIGREGRTVLLVSHNMPSIINLCQRALLFNQGTIVAAGETRAVVDQYMAGCRSLGGEAYWPEVTDAPGNDVVRLHAVRILQEGSDGPTADVDISKDVLVEILYWNLQDNVRLYSGLWLKDQVGSFVLSSGNAHSVSLTRDNWYSVPHPVGLFRSVCRIPGNFLNEGMYSISAIVGKNTQETQVLQDQVVSFQVHDTGEMRKEYLGTWVGVVRPKLAWQTEQVALDRKVKRCA